METPHPPEHAVPTRGFRSLTTRLIFWVLLLGGATAAVTLALADRVSREWAVGAAEREAVQATEAGVSGADEVLRAIEEGTRVLAASVEATAPPEAELEALLRRFVAGNPHVYGSAAAYARAAFQPSRERFSPYLHRASIGSSEITRADLASAAYRYWERDWYTQPTLSREPRWSEPYFDAGGGNVTMVTYSVPVFGPEDGRPVRAVVTADVHLDWVGRLARGVRVGRSGFAILLSREGRVLAHPDLPEAGASFVEQLEPGLQRRTAPFVARMMSGRTGFERLDLPEGSYRLTYAPVDSTGWSLAAVYPERELMEGATRLRTLQASLGAAGLGALAVVVVVLSRRLTSPLRELAGKARELAGGELDLPLPEVRSRDELGALTAAFRHMRDSLKAHIRDLQETTAARTRLESELKLARRIQLAMLPEERAGGPRDGYALAARLLPARAVGGDLYDHFVRDGKVYFLVADVSGKGVGAAIFMARAKTLFEEIASEEADPARILARINRGLCRENEEGMYVTGVCGTLDAASGELVLAVAGHDPPVRTRPQGPPRPLEVEGGPVLGLMEGAAFPTNRVGLEPGEEIVVYTDGVTDARDQNDGMFGTERLAWAVAGAARSGAGAVTDAVFEDVQNFAHGVAQADDITVLTLQHRPLG